MNALTLSHPQNTASQAIFTIHTDVVTEWRRKVCGVLLIAREFTRHGDALTTLERVRKSNPKAFSKPALLIKEGAL